MEFLNILTKADMRKLKGKIVTCAICNKEFYREPYLLKKNNFCSFKCYHEGLKDENLFKDWREKMSLIKKTNPIRYWLGKKRPNIGKLFKKINIGKIPWNKGIKVPEITGENHHLWKGDEVGYDSLHRWVERQLGKPKYCEICKSTNAKRYEWANLSGNYKRDVKDWIRLCKSCHIKKDDVLNKVWKIRRSKYSDVA